ncbi:MAG: methyltransferase domain-containing protein [Candidatus Aadella gelida]|nr:methyltransferase domain-containing protein [Candidatus Aadella gelida]
MDKRLIEQNFSRNAGVYDNHASVQRKCAESLTEFIRERSFSRILEVGCGTGFYTGMLREMNDAASIDAIDLSEEMIDIARSKDGEKLTEFRVCDGEEIFAGEKFDLVTSNASFQWFQDFEGSLERFKNTMTENGVICFSMYGPETFKELQEILSDYFGKYLPLTSEKFISFEEAQMIVGRYFKNVLMREEKFTVDFVSLWDFLRDIKRSGTRGEGLARDIFLGKYTMKALEKAYIEKFKGIRATHHIYFCRAEK